MILFYENLYFVCGDLLFWSGCSFHLKKIIIPGVFSLPGHGDAAACIQMYLVVFWKFFFSFWYKCFLSRF